MLPIVLDVARLDIALIGDGAAAEKRLTLLDDAAAARLRVYAPSPSAAFTAASGERLVRRLPEGVELAAARLVFIADRAAPYAAAVAARARAAGALVHIEDDAAQTDFHLPAVLRRGDLTIAVSTGGGSPTLAVRVRRALADLFGPEWQGRTDEIAKLRREWRDAGADAEALKHRTENWIERQRWLPEPSSRS
ncbi:MAG TPA: NAD(P)-dependent oxidoreductase [Stellaceae bacterium]|jgi:precorrin-2 dehydrogenase/sirohydrochlorin ferrochelatase|nr:NAD(P)-dependent oxidoreductase [Stellaceae bacterium]